MSSLSWRTRRATLVLSIGAAALLAGACSNSGTSNPPASGGSTLPKTLVFSPLSLQPPALKGLSEGVKGYAGSKGWDVIVQDPNFDPTKQTQSLNEVLSSGRAGAAWVIAVAPASMGAGAQGGPGEGHPDPGQRPPRRVRLLRAAAGHHVRLHRLRRRPARSLGEQLGKCMNAKLGGKGSVLFFAGAAGLGRQGGVREGEPQDGAQGDRARGDHRADARRHRPAPAPRPPSVTSCRASPTSRRSWPPTTRARSVRSAPSPPPARR